MANLLTLPRELRDDILTLVLYSPCPTPKTPADVESQDRFTLSKIGRAIYYLKDASNNRPTAPALLLTSKQTHTETKEILDRFGNTLELDVKFVRESYIAPTWISIPMLPKNVDRVRATFQSTGLYKHRYQLQEEPYRMHRNIWSGGDGRPPNFAWMFYDLLNNFFTFGPTTPDESKRQTPRVLSLGCLELDFIDPEDTGLLQPVAVTYKERSGARNLYQRVGWRDPDQQTVRMLRPEWIADKLAREFQSLLYMSYHTSKYGGILYERIGNIVFKVNGTTTKEFQLGETLGRLQFSDSFGHVRRERRLSYWIRWKENALRLRKASGLQTVEFEPAWKEEARREATRTYMNRHDGTTIENLVFE